MLFPLPEGEGVKAMLCIIVLFCTCGVMPISALTAFATTYIIEKLTNPSCCAPKARRVTIKGISV
jgi:hypothetical protein